MDERYFSGNIWGEVRSGLSRYRERLVAAYDAGSYDQESVLLDAIARDIAAKVTPMVETFAEKKRDL
ncbi:hypothetical protein [Roseibium album]|uniref:hypothetical protein n=1 Tax=Roseibium album TaxID=311410 RepID=UPI003BAE44DD